MQRIIKIPVLLLIVVSLAFAGCSSSKKGSCGCPNRQGMVGY